MKWCISNSLWNINKKKKKLRSSHKEILELKSTITEMKFTRGIWRLIYATEEKAGNLKIGQWIWLNLKNRGKKDWRKVNRAWDPWDIVGVSEEERKGQREYLKDQMAKTCQI